MVRVDGATDLWCRVETSTTRECPPGAETPRARTGGAVRSLSLVAGWALSNAQNMCHVPGKALEFPRGANRRGRGRSGLGLE